MSEEVKAVPPLATCMSPPPPPPPPPPPNSNDIPSPSLPINVPVPNQKMKMLPWIRIASIKDQCVWTKIKQMEDKVPVNYPQLEKQFHCKEIKNKRSSAVPKNILNHQKAVNIEMLFKNNKKSPDELLEMIRPGSTNPLGLKFYQSLKENLPNTDEANSLREILPEELKKLSPAEYFLSRLISLPHYALWIDAMTTMETIEIPVNITSHLQNISNACDLLMTNESFETFLRYVLHVGLFMNKGKDTGIAVGFDLCSLQKLSETKSTDDSVTLLEFLVHEILKSHSTCLKFVDDFQDILQRPGCCELKKDTDEFNATKKKFEEFQVQIEAATSEIKDQCFKFIQNGKTQIENVSEKLENLKRKSKEVADHFAIKNINVDELFKCLREMCGSIDNIQVYSDSIIINFSLLLTSYLKS
ncbi:unnamed protein product [Mytilus edulis]|uniref:FH2 domain-containing protein n=1 Tax=Mytilus edulis TaxID=6550 RepID=A0A8S3QQP8_MYTED|nr:unnamed protein product [Mytilus edulis]